MRSNFQISSKITKDIQSDITLDAMLTQLATENPNFI